MDLWSLKVLSVTKYEAHLAKSLPENILKYSLYMCCKSILYVEDKIVFEDHKDPTQGCFAIFFTYFAL